MGGTATPHAVITPLVGERRHLLPGETARGSHSCKPDVVCAPGDARRAGEGGPATQEMICVPVEITDGPVNRRVRVTAPSIRRALALGGGGSPGREVRLIFPIDPEAFFVSSGLSRQALAVSGSPEIHAHARRSDRARERNSQGRFSEKPGEEQPPFDKAGPPKNGHRSVSEVVTMRGMKPTGAGRKGARVARTGH